MDINKQITLKHYNNNSELPAQIQAILLAATEACATAYAPYSQFYVGAAVLLSNGQIYTGSNQENAAYPSGLCAERVLLNMVTHLVPNEKIIAMAVTARSTKHVIPKILPSCGGCLQVMSEVVMRQKAEFKIYTFTPKAGIYEAQGVSSFLPFGFELIDQ
jgi:cytidine deaminase